MRRARTIAAIAGVVALGGAGAFVVASNRAGGAEGPTVGPAPATITRTDGGSTTDRSRRRGCPGGKASTTPAPSAPISRSSAAAARPPAALSGDARWDLVFDDEFTDQASTNSKWDNGMRSGAHTLEGNGELQWYLPANSVVTTDDDGTGEVGVLRQTLRRESVPDTAYPTSTLQRIYPPSQCPQYYEPDADADAGADASTPSNPERTRVPYQFTSGMLNSSKSFGFKYGYVETRVKMPKGFALWPALWLRDWQPWSYEVDVVEGFDAQARTFRTGYYWGSGRHRSTASDDGDLGVTSDGEPCRQHVPIPATSQSPNDCSLAIAVDLSEGYHTIGLNWTASRYELYFDGVKRWTSPAGADVAKDYNHLILNLALGNNADEFDWTRQPVKPFDADLFTSTSFSKPTVEWDYVRVWQPATAHDVCAPPACG